MKVLKLLRVLMVALFTLAVIGAFVMPYTIYEVIENKMQNENRYVSQWPINEEWWWINYPIDFFDKLCIRFWSMSYNLMRLSFNLKDDFKRLLQNKNILVKGRNLS